MATRVKTFIGSNGQGAADGSIKHLDSIFASGSSPSLMITGQSGSLQNTARLLVSSDSTEWKVLSLLAPLVATYRAESERKTHFLLFSLFKCELVEA